MMPNRLTCPGSLSEMLIEGHFTTIADRLDHVAFSRQLSLSRRQIPLGWIDSCRPSARIFVFLLVGGLTARCPAAPTAAVFRSFDGPELTWQSSGSRPGSQLLAHGCVADDARQGSGSERIVIAAPGGEAVHFICEVGRVPVLEELEARLWVKASRPGAALAARVVLPRAIDAKTGRPRTALVSGDECVLPNRWQQLRLADVTGLLAAEARVMRASLGAAIDTREAFVDAVVLVVPGGPDRTTVWTDALEIDGIVMPAITVAKRPVSKPIHDPQVRPAQHWQMAQAPPSATTRPHQLRRQLQLRLRPK